VLVIPLRLAVKVYSGIRPPPALLQAMSNNRRMGKQPQASTAAYQDNPPPKPPRPANQPFEMDNNADDNDAPPSYEDAMADMISPIDGPRREYQATTPAEDRSLSGPPSGPIGDTKAPIIDPDEEDYHEERINNNAAASFSRSSSESIDMLPQSPGVRPTSYADSIFEDAASSPAMGAHKPRQQNQINVNATNNVQAGQQTLSQAPPRRAFSTGVPSRRPVPNSGQSQGRNAS
jgi:hypothetical protein